MIQACLLSRRIKFDEDFKVVTEFSDSCITTFEVDEKSHEETDVIEISTELEKQIQQRKILLPKIKYLQFESNLKKSHPQLYESIRNKENLSKWVFGAALKLKDDVVNKNKDNYDLKMLPSFSAQNFIAGRASFMKNNILSLLTKHESKHFHPQLLKDLVNQEYELSDYFKPDMMNKELKLRDVKVKFFKTVVLNKTIFVPKIKNKNDKNWKPAHAVGMRHKMIRNLDHIDKGIIELIRKKAVIVVGSEKDEQVLKYALVISQIHTVVEHRFCPIAKKPIRRIRETLDAWIINEVTEKISFRMMTGADITNVLEQLEIFASFDNKTSFYNCFVSPLSRKFLCFSWRGLILTYLVPVFGLCNSPATNETFMILLRLELSDILLTLDLEDYIFVSTCWIDDALIATKKGTFLPYNLAPILLLYALIALQVGVTINIQKSSFQNDTMVEYLGLQLFAETKEKFAYFAVKKQVVMDFVGFLLSSFDSSDSHWEKLLLSEEFLKNGWETFNHKIKNDLLRNTLSYNNIEQVTGRLGWINRNNTIDLQAIHIDILYRSSAAWKHPWMINAAKMEIFNLPKNIKKLVAIPQIPNPLELDYYINLDWCLTARRDVKNWFGIAPINVSGMFNWEIPLSSKAKIWIKNGDVLTNVLQKIQDDVVTFTTNNLQNNNGFFTISRPKPFADCDQKGLIVIIVKIINSWILNEPGKISKNTMISFRMLQLLKENLWTKLGICAKFKIVRDTPKKKPSELSYWQPTIKWFENVPWKEENTICLFKNEILNEKLAKIDGFSISWHIKNSMTPHFATVNHVTFWQSIRTRNDPENNTKKIEVILINTEIRKIIRRIVNIIYNKPKNVLIIWPVFNSKLLRLISLMLAKLEPTILYLSVKKLMVFKNRKWSKPQKKAIATLVFANQNE